MVEILTEGRNKPWSNILTCDECGSRLRYNRPDLLSQYEQRKNLAFYESNVYYIIRCPHCHKGLRLTDEQLPPEYRKVTQNPPVITISNSEEIMSDNDDEQLVKNYRDCSATMRPV